MRRFTFWVTVGTALALIFAGAAAVEPISVSPVNADEHLILAEILTDSLTVTQWWHGQQYIPPHRALDLVNNEGPTSYADVVYQSVAYWGGPYGLRATVLPYPGICTGVYVSLVDAGSNLLGYVRYTHIDPTVSEGWDWPVPGTGTTNQHVGTIKDPENADCVSQGLWRGAHLHQGVDLGHDPYTGVNEGLEQFLIDAGHRNVIEPRYDWDDQWVLNTLTRDADGDTLTDQEETDVYFTDPHRPDTDGDGCAETEDLNMGFNPLSQWDVMDVPVPANPDPTPSGARNKVVDIGDVLGVLFYGFAEDDGPPNGNGVDYDSLKDGDWAGLVRMWPDGRVNQWDQVGYRYDRTASTAPNPPWDAGPPNGVVDIQDVLAALAQAFVVDCSGPPPPGGQGASAGEGAGPSVTGDGMLASARNAMAVDAATGGAVDSARTVKGAGSFDIDIAVTAAKNPYSGYQFVLSYDDQVLALLPTTDVDRDGTLESWTYRRLDGVTLDAEVAGRDLDRDSVADQAAGGSALLSGTTSATGVIATLRFQCVGNGTSPVHLAAPGEDTFGTTTFAPGGAPIDTSLADAWITCWVN